MNGTLAVTRYTLIELSRRRILLVFFIIGAIGIALLAVGLRLLYTAILPGVQSGRAGAQLTPEQVNQVVEYLFVTQILGVLGIFALLIAFALGMTTIYHDLDSGAAVSIFAAVGSASPMALICSFTRIIVFSACAANNF